MWLLCLVLKFSSSSDSYCLDSTLYSWSVYMRIIILVLFHKTAEDVYLVSVSIFPAGFQGFGHVFGADFYEV